MSESERGSSSQVGRLVFKNTFYLTFGQVLTIPIAIALNAVLARYLGPETFGYIYFASTLTSFGFLAVAWGQHGVLPNLVANDTSVAGRALGSSLVWRAALGVLVYAVLAVGCRMMGYAESFQWIFLLVFLNQCLVGISNACKDVIRGFERADIPAAIQVLQQLSRAMLMIPVLVLGGSVLTVLGAGTVALTLLLIPVFRATRSIGVRHLEVTRATFKTLFKDGAPWVAFGTAMVLQPNVDALYLAELAPPEVMGWYAVSRRLVGTLILPATALIGALYPTLCRLWGSDRDSFVQTSRGAIRSVSLVVVPVALCTAFFPEVGVALFSRDSFGEAEDNLRILSVFVLLVYFSMPIGQTILASGRQKMWAGVQALCVLVSVVLDPLLVPAFQESHGNGGLGLCIAAVISEVVVVGCGLVLLPSGVMNWKLVKSIALSLLSGTPMAAIAYFGSELSLFLTVPASLIAYVVTARIVRALEPSDVEFLKQAFGRRLARMKSALRRRKP